MSKRQPRLHQCEHYDGERRCRKFADGDSNVCWLHDMTPEGVRSRAEWKARRAIPNRPPSRKYVMRLTTQEFKDLCVFFALSDFGKEP